MTPMSYRDMAPNFRCTVVDGVTHIEIPAKLKWQVIRRLSS